MLGRRTRTERARTSDTSVDGPPRTAAGPAPVYRGHRHYDDVAHAARHFVYSYYLSLAGAPHEAWRFFTDGAQYTHVDGQGPAEALDLRPAVGHRQIHENIVHQRFAECEFLIRSVNVQLTSTGCVALITGDTSRRGRDDPPVRFVQSLVLERAVPRRDQAVRYAISNSILKVYTVSPPMPPSEPLARPSSVCPRTAVRSRHQST